MNEPAFDSNLVEFRPPDARTQEKMRRRTEEIEAHTGPQALDTAELLTQIAGDAKSLLEMEVELAKAEGKADLNSEIDLAKGAIIAAVCALLGLNMLIMGAVLALWPAFAWLAAIIVGIVLLCIAGIAAWIGWQRAEKNPLGTTRETLKEDVQWAKQQIK